jgi:hypothetical protein
MADAFREPLLKSDFVTIRTFIERWGKPKSEFPRASGSLR